MKRLGSRDKLTFRESEIKNSVTIHWSVPSNSVLLYIIAFIFDCHFSFAQIKPYDTTI